ncbi:MAG: hypothetical protein RIC24_00430 [Hyphomicrobiales bacterium]|jgi:hypothetical protein
MPQSFLPGFILFALLAAPQPLAHSQDTYAWQDLAGTWRGEGLLRAAPEADLEQGVCRFDIEASSDNTLTLSGRCATAAQTGQVSTQINRSDNGTITGSATSPLVAAPVALSGTQSGGTLALSSTAPVEMEGQSYTVSSQIDGWLGDGVFTLIQRLAQPDTAPVVVMQMRFTRSP